MAIHKLELEPTNNKNVENVEKNSVPDHSPEAREFIDEYKNRLDLSVVTTDKLEEGLEHPKNIEYVFIYNRGVAASIGAGEVHALGKKVIFASPSDGKDLQYDSLMKEGDELFKLDTYQEKASNSLPKDEVFRRILDISTGSSVINFRDIFDKKGLSEEDELKFYEALGENKNLIDLLEFCKEKNINPNEVAIDPWYGMKSEDAKMIKVAEILGFNFVGASSEAVALIGDKVSANKFAEKTELTPPPNSGEVQSVEDDLLPFLEKEEYKNRRIVLKQADGGGGAGQFLANISIEEGKQSLIDESQKWIDKGLKFDANLWIENDRHVEMQAMGDGNGKFIFGSPRDCTNQRAKQKIIEETASWLTDDQFEMLKNAATAFFKQVEEKLGHPYKGPATFEMLYDTVGDKFYFLEVNTRKQVEILVSEHQNGDNLVQSAIKIAEGYTLKDDDGSNSEYSESQEKGHTIEARITLERPLTEKEIKFFKDQGSDKVAMPIGGKVSISQGDETQEGVFLYLDKRVLAEGRQTEAQYDSMVGQLVVKAENRDSAIEKLIKALEDLEISGLSSNKELCLAILNSKEFKNNTHNSKTPTVDNFMKKYRDEYTKKIEANTTVNNPKKGAIVSISAGLTTRFKKIFSPEKTEFIPLSYSFASHNNLGAPIISSIQKGEIPGIKINTDNNHIKVVTKEGIENLKKIMSAENLDFNDFFTKIVLHNEEFKEPQEYSY